MKRGLLFAVFGLAVLHGATANSAEPSDVEEIERIVREYLLREPEVIYEAIQELQLRRETVEREQRQAAIVERRDDIFENPSDPVVGNPDGDVTLVEFFDYRCGYCRQMAPAMQGLIAQDENLRVVLKEFPILGPDSVVAARAALAAKIQGEYGPFHFALMDADHLTAESVLQMAAEHGLDPVRLEEDMESEEVLRQIDENIELAQSLGITGTPSFIVGDTLVPGAISIAQLNQLIVDERNKIASN